MLANASARTKLSRVLLITSHWPLATLFSHSTLNPRHFSLPAHLAEPNSSTVSNGLADHGRKRLSVNFVLLSGLHVHEHVVVFLLGRLPLPIQIRRVVRGHLDVRPAGKDRILFGAAAAQQQVLHAVHLVKLGRVHVPVEDDDVQVLGVRGNRSCGDSDLRGWAPMPERAKAGLWKAIKTLWVPAALASSSHCLQLLHLFFVRGPSRHPTPWARDSRICRSTGR